MASAIGRLLDELSWEGNARKYRNGGLGLENVLTAEVVQGLDFLPREVFLAGVLGRATCVVGGADGKAAVRNAAQHAEDARIEVLLGDLSVPELGVKAQPDAVIESPASYVFIEAKRVRGGAFQPEQLAREVLLSAVHGAGRQPVLLLILGEPPPVAVKGHGRATVEGAISHGMDLIEARIGRDVRAVAAGCAVAYLSWSEILLQIQSAAGTYENSDRSTHFAVQRVASSVVDAVSRHS